MYNTLVFHTFMDVLIDDIFQFKLAHLALSELFIKVINTSQKAAIFKQSLKTFISIRNIFIVPVKTYPYSVIVFIKNACTEDCRTYLEENIVYYYYLSILLMNINILSKYCDIRLCPVCLFIYFRFNDQPVSIIFLCNLVFLLTW
jgi:hypothetical protein